MGLSLLEPEQRGYGDLPDDLVPDSSLRRAVGPSRPGGLQERERGQSPIDGVTSAGPEPSFLPVPIDTISWQGDHVRMIDQTRLPNERVEIEIRTVPEWSRRSGR